MCLSQHFVPKYLDVNHLSCNQAKKHNTNYALEFFDDNVTIIWNGTYIYIGKSSTHSTHRGTYLRQKYRHLFKFISLVLSAGYVVDIVGPFRGNTNDASAAQHILHTRHLFIGWYEHDDDVMIVDHGFRNVIDTFRGIRYESKMPTFLRKGRTQHKQRVTTLYQKSIDRRTISYLD